MMVQRVLSLLRSAAQSISTPPPEPVRSLKPPVKPLKSLTLMHHICHTPPDAIANREVPLPPPVQHDYDLPMKLTYFSQFFPCILAEAYEQIASRWNSISFDAVITWTKARKVKDHKAKTFTLFFTSDTPPPKFDYPLVRVVVHLEHAALPGGGVMGMLDSIHPQMDGNKRGSQGSLTVFSSTVPGTWVPVSIKADKKISFKALGSLVPAERMADACTGRIISPHVFDTLGGISSKRRAAGQGKDLVSVDPRALQARLERKTKIYCKSLNRGQNAAIHLMRTTTHPIIVVEGPPGTGKTMTVVELIHQTDPKPECKTLVTGPSNKAVQTDAERFLQKYGRAYEEKGLSVCLLGVADKLPESLQNISVDYLSSELRRWLKRAKVSTKLEGGLDALHSRYSDEIRPWIMRLAPSLEVPSLAEPDQTLKKKREKLRKVIKTLSKVDIKESCVSEAAVVFATLVSSGRRTVRQALKLQQKPSKGRAEEEEEGCQPELARRKKKKKKKKSVKVGHLIIDEAAQALETEALIALGANPDRVVVVGDVRQLPPCILSKEASAHDFFATSFMARVLQRGCPSILLEEQYRMHPDIQRFPSETFYGGRLHPGESVLQRTWCYPDGAPQYMQPFSFINIQGAERAQGDSHSMSNMAEADALCAIVAELRALETPQRKLNACIIATYRGQVNLINQRLKCLLGGTGGIRVSTVDSFQGDECDIVLVSLVRANPGGSIGFLQDTRRLNVSLTRAKHSLIVLGNAETLEQSGCDPFVSLVRGARASGTLFPASALQERATAGAAHPAAALPS
eukprot:TRINITY_DN5837_c0_g1_i1.p1 TRINITY_DN5837_c0_g1~~TRINITY_DN5837_c0_g1_i1.p1  ORF type:complete len:820 (+),score=228.00 TRINITY_DN5837_c0_g1_i1:65-2461(+)